MGLPSMLQLLVPRVTLITSSAANVSSTITQCHVSGRVASLGCTSCLSSKAFSGGMQPHASSSCLSVASSCMFFALAMALFILICGSSTTCTASEMLCSCQPGCLAKQDIRALLLQC